MLRVHAWNYSVGIKIKKSNEVSDVRWSNIFHVTLTSQINELVFLALRVRRTVYSVVFLARKCITFINKLTQAAVQLGEPTTVYSL